MTSGLDQKDSTLSSSDWDPEDLKDAWCDPDNPTIIQFEDISAAAYRIKSGIVRTSCDPSHMNNDVCMDMFFKKDYNSLAASRSVGRGIH